MKKYRLGEYKIVKGVTSHCQKVLNQWRHQYNLTIHKMLVFQDRDGDIWITILVERNEKEPTKEVSQ